MVFFESQVGMRLALDSLQREPGKADGSLVLDREELLYLVSEVGGPEMVFDYLYGAEVSEVSGAWVWLSSCGEDYVEVWLTSSRRPQDSYSSYVRVL